LKKSNKIAFTAIATAIIFSSAAFADTSVLDTESDPLVTLSYITEILKPQLTSEILAEVNNLLQDISDMPPVSYNNFQVIHMNHNQELIASGPLELILRAGECKAFISLEENIKNGVGLSDLTGALEILSGQALTKNHYILIPRADGRGIIITSSEAYIMVRGEYQIVSN